jgi:hypothetical protein
LVLDIGGVTRLNIVCTEFVTGASQPAVIGTAPSVAREANAGYFLSSTWHILYQVIEHCAQKNPPLRATPHFLLALLSQAPK